jgi:hypothetical protein
MKNLPLLKHALIEPAQMDGLSDQDLCNIASDAYQVQLDCELKRAVAEAGERAQSIVWLALAMQEGRAAVKAA